MGTTLTRKLGLAVLALITATGLAAAQTAPVTDKDIDDAYVYLLGRALVIRQEMIDRSGPDFSYNRINYNPVGSADFVNPNFDVSYLEAWFATDDKAAALLEIPEVKGRYYTAQILDEWGEVIANINDRTFPTKPYGTFALVKPGSNVAVPPGAGRIELHSGKAKMLARIEIKGDTDGALALQRAFKVTTLGTPEAAPPPRLPMFGNQDLVGVEIFDDADAKLASALDVAPNSAEMQQKVRAVSAYAASSAGARAEVDAKLRDVIRRFREDALTKSAPYRNHWLCGTGSGNYGGDFRRRTAANYAGIWANTSNEVVYFVATRDAEEKPLDGSGGYVMHFAADRLPEAVVDAYWSVILVGVPDYRVVPNPLNRFNFNNLSTLTKEVDGSLKIAVGPKPVAGVPKTNWLPSAEGRPFSLTFRAYVPREVVKRCEWTPPSVARIEGARP
ncbi:protein of unknown function DUF1214 [Methylobacterium sp. 4-46]|uniref:DUF1214 domain-containing protein n=1 Tax=unclassified Methylobacterium TaxID=2615210 RepID=UPI000152C728|nr:MULTISPECIES: DUF1214 domain-containing protein [Methylobacterium]ACA15734.1 protein of unknown function DUF1214 [Methylobacterium sp. 4-46]WFT81467.1 DUF1214 domain-containing protein [Methylobacterium nodulans]